MVLPNANSSANNDPNRLHDAADHRAPDRNRTSSNHLSGQTQLPILSNMSSVYILLKDRAARQSRRLPAVKGTCGTPPALPVPSLYATYPTPLSPSYWQVRPKVNPLDVRGRDGGIRITMETEDATYHNQCRSEIKQHEELERYHRAWKRYYYGSPAEKELHRLYLREALKTQIQEMEERRRAQKATQSGEFAHITKEVNAERVKGLEAEEKHRQYLQSFRDANKRLIELRNAKRLEERAKDLAADREMLKINPINWRCTLK
ncbi:hypothetical protein AAHC03_010186 [Spirometra sp. Aus1]